MEDKDKWRILFIIRFGNVDQRIAGNGSDFPSLPLEIFGIEWETEQQD